MFDRDTLLGSAEIVGAVVLVGATFTLSFFTPGGGVEDPLWWRLIAIFMFATGLGRLREQSPERCQPA